MNAFANTFRGRRVLVTGHTGFKGSWLSLWLHELGANVTGIALSPEGEPSHWNLLKLPITERLADIRESQKLQGLIREANPEIIFHLAAQALVRRSYVDPIATWSTNVVGTASVLEGARQVPGIRAIVVVTTDKCYENKEWEWAYRENDSLGGHDPYSASKAGSELVVASYRNSFFHSTDSALLATARAGNVIGGGDWSADRLIPDLVRSINGDVPLEIRSPQSTRPWQHVLECISGYLMLGKKLLDGQKDFAQAWNFGPDEYGNQTVEGVLDILKGCWPSLRWQLASKVNLHEAKLLHLDSSKAKIRLRWRPIWNLQTALRATADWYRTYAEQRVVLSRDQLKAYLDAAKACGAEWTKP